jgi:hypothetical protein
MRHRGRGPSEPAAEDRTAQGQRGKPSLWLLAQSMARCAHRTKNEMASTDMLAATNTRGWHLDDGDPLALLHRATAHEAARQQEILDIAMAVVGRDGRGPGSAPHLVIRRDGSLGSALVWSGGPQAALVDDAMPSYLMVDAVLMKRACERPRDIDLIRRKMVTDARAPTGGEIAFANQSAALLEQYKGAVVASSRTARDIEMAEDAKAVHNARLADIGDSPASWHHAQAEMTEGQLIAEPEHDNPMMQAAPREAPVASGTMRAALRATRMDQTNDPGVRRAAAQSRGGDMSDRVAPSSDLVRGTGAVRVGRPEPSRRTEYA